MNTNAKVKKQRKSISRAEMMRYMARHKLKKKQPRIQPRTYANTQGLSTARLQPASQPQIKKPIVHQNVKARLESDLEHLLENQGKLIRRVRAPESYVSIQTDKSKLPKLPNVSHGESAENQSKKRTLKKSTPVQRINLTKKDGKSPSSLLSPSRTVYTLSSSASQVSNLRSFEIDTIKNRIQAGEGTVTPALSGVPSEFYELSTTKRRNEQKNWAFDEPQISEPLSLVDDLDYLSSPNAIKAKDVLNYSGSKRGNKAPKSKTMGKLDSTPPEMEWFSYQPDIIELPGKNS